MRLSQYKQQAINNPWAWGLILACVVFVVANMGFIYLAFSHSGQAVPQHVFHGLSETQHHDKETSPWHMVLSLPTLYHQTPHELSVSITGDERVDEAMSVTLFAYRPSDQQADFQQVLTANQGQFQAHITLPLIGQWDLEIEAVQGQQRQRLTRRVYVYPKAS